MLFVLFLVQYFVLFVFSFRSGTPLFVQLSCLPFTRSLFVFPHAEGAKSAEFYISLYNHACAEGVASFATTESAETLTANHQPVTTNPSFFRHRGDPSPFVQQSCLPLTHSPSGYCIVIPCLLARDLGQRSVYFLIPQYFCVFFFYFQNDILTSAL